MPINNTQKSPPSLPSPEYSDVCVISSSPTGNGIEDLFRLFLMNVSNTRSDLSTQSEYRTMYKVHRSTRQSPFSIVYQTMSGGLWSQMISSDWVSVDLLLLHSRQFDEDLQHSKF